MVEEIYASFRLKHLFDIVFYIRIFLSMKQLSPPSKNKPFKDLKKLLNNCPIKLSPEPRGKNNEAKAKPFAKTNEKELFEEAMADVRPLENRWKRVISKAPPLPNSLPPDDTDSDVLFKLKQLVQYGTGFTVSLTPEYMEGVGPKVCPELTQRLHRGDFSIQAHIDLHGLGVSDARKTCENFLQMAVKNSLQAVLVVHGRGLSSSAAPVLKTHLYNWLTKGPWRKQVLAFASAQNYDGGAGATYIMLRQKPLVKHQLKNSNPSS
jgi:DNA-nicking Smr family endonuclease